MTAYQPQPGMHPGMAPHGHPGMTPGQPMNPAQMQQMGHPGASGPGAPHVSQPGAMMGMQPGANTMGGNGGMGGQHPGGQMGGMPGQMGGQSMAGGAPNAQALSHMNPQAMMQQQHMQQQSEFSISYACSTLGPQMDTGERLDGAYHLNVSGMVLTTELAKYSVGASSPHPRFGSGETLNGFKGYRLRSQSGQPGSANEP